MNKKGTSSMIFWITIIIAVIIVGITFGIVSDQTATTPITADQFTAVNNSCVRLTTNCIQVGSTSSVINQSGAESVGNFTECGDLNKPYGLLLLDEGGYDLDGKTLNASYTEQNCIRVTGLTSTIINYVPLLLAVVLLVFVAVQIKA